MHIIVKESKPRRELTEHQSDVCRDSCVEWFVNFLPERCDRYFNFKVNPNGAMHVAFRRTDMITGCLRRKKLKCCLLKHAYIEIPGR